MVFQLPRHVRRAVCALAVAAYVLPAMLGTLTLLGHAVDHLADEALEQRRIAASLGLTHGSSSQPDAEEFRSGLPTLPASSNAVVHTHGGTTHAHDGPVSDLIRITGHVDGTLTTDASAPGQLASHVPASTSVVALSATSNVQPTPATFSTATPAHTQLRLRPPRA